MTTSVTVAFASPAADVGPTAVLSSNRSARTKNKKQSMSSGGGGGRERRRKIKPWIMLCTTCTMTIASLIALSNSIEYMTSFRSTKLFVNDPTTTATSLLKKRSPVSPSTSITIPSEKRRDDSPAAESPSTTINTTSNQPLCSAIYSNDNESLQHDYRKGSWVFNDNDADQDADATSSTSSGRVLFPYYGGEDEVWGPYCTELERQYNETGKIPDYLKYDWQPQTCRLLKFDMEQFCNAIVNKTIGIIGDSISQQFAHSLIGMVHGALIQDESEFLQPPTWNNKLTVPLCSSTAGTDDDDTTTSSSPKNTAKLVFLRHNKYIANDTQSKQALEEISYISDYLIMNWGVHYQPWNEMENAVNEFLNVLESTWTLANNKQPNNLFWRTTIVAHSNCSTAIVPDDNNNGDNNGSGNFNIHNNPKYNTDEILLQDIEIVQPRIKIKSSNDLSSLNMTSLDVTTSTMLRRDGHRIIGHKGTEDCLHYCEPGPIDTWVDLFYHHIMMMENEGNK